MGRRSKRNELHVVNAVSGDREKEKNTSIRFSDHFRFFFSSSVQKSGSAASALHGPSVIRILQGKKKAQYKKGEVKESSSDDELNDVEIGF